MNKTPEYKTIVLAYFSGTNCTKKVVDRFKKRFDELGIGCTQVSTTECSAKSLKRSDLIMFFSPVHAFRLTANFEKWMKGLLKTTHTKAAVISVSGGGEVSPNTACRIKAKRILSNKGYKLIYEDMFSMPSNFAIPTPKEEFKEMLEVLPRKVDQIVSDILLGKKNILTPKTQDRIIATLGKAEHFGGIMFGKFLNASKDCNQCGLCIRDCPKKNIKLKNNKIKFGYKCVWCMKCVYSCPKNAISPRLLKSAKLKDGFNVH